MSNYATYNGGNILVGSGEEIPQYTMSPAVVYARNIITEKRDDYPFKWHVWGWANTMLNMAFHGGDWYSCPCRDLGFASITIADLVVENLRMTPGGPTGVRFDPKLRVVTVLDKVGGSPLEEILDRGVSSVAQKVQEVAGNTGNHAYSTHIVVIRGMQIGFFEYHHHESWFLTANKIPNFFSCTSLTQELKEIPAVSAVPQGVKLLFDDNLTRAPLTPDTRVALDKTRDHAKNYTVPCIFDLDDRAHHEYVNFFYHHMAKQPPRQIG
jgi:hypothetical protein